MNTNRTATKELDMQDTIRDIRKHGSLAVDTIAEADAIVAAAATAGRTFSRHGHGFGFLVMDRDD